MPENGTVRTADGVTLAWSRRPGRPEAPRLALAHSLAQDMTFWDGVAHALNGEADILAYDARGHGKSSSGAGPYTVEMFADDLAAVMDAAAWPDAVVAGCSMGGCVAQAFGARHAARARGLVLIDTTAWYGPDAPRAWRERVATAREKGLAALADFQATRWFGDRFRAEQPEALRRRMEVFLATDLDGYAWSCEMLGDADLRPTLPRLTMPVAVVVGEEDYATTMAMAEALRDGIPGATLTVLPGARHLTPVERPAEVAAAIRAVLNGSGKSAAR